MEFPQRIKLDQSKIVKSTSISFFQVSLMCICILLKAFKKQLSFIQGCRWIRNTVFRSTRRSPTLSETRRLLFSMHAAGAFSMLRIFKANYFSSLFFSSHLCVYLRAAEKIRTMQAHSWVDYLQKTCICYS